MAKYLSGHNCLPAYNLAHNCPPAYNLAYNCLPAYNLLAYNLAYNLLGHQQVTRLGWFVNETPSPSRVILPAGSYRGVYPRH